MPKFGVGRAPSLQQRVLNCQELGSTKIMIKILKGVVAVSWGKTKREGEGVFLDVPKLRGTEILENKVIFIFYMLSFSFLVPAHHLTF